MEKLLAEIEWMSAHKVEYIACADANFGILPRDEEIVDALVAAHGRSGYPRLLNYNTAKSFDERLFRIAEKLSRHGLDRVGPNFAVQSLSPTVLRNIGRVNIDDATLSAWIRRCHRAGYRAHTDLILGLPGETLQSFCAGVEKLLSLGQHEGIQYFPCNILPNALLAAPAMREKYAIRTARRVYKWTLEDTPEAEQIPEFMDVVTETADMPHEDWLKANYFMQLVQGAHSYGPLRLCAIYLHTEGIISYAAFYLRLLEFCHMRPDTLVGEAVARMERNFHEMTQGEETLPLELPGFRFQRMYEDQYFFGRAVQEPDRFYAGVSEFLGQFGAEPELLRYQRESIILPGAAEKALGFAYNFPAYFAAANGGQPVPLRKRAIRLRFSFDFDLSDRAKYYDTIVQLGRYTSRAFYKVEELPT